MTLSEFKRKEKERLKKQKIKPLQKISNTFIDNTIHKNNLSALKTIFYLSTVLGDIDLSKYKEDELVNIEIDTRQMFKYTNLTSDLIRRSLKTMQETSITFINEQEKWEMGINLLPMYKIAYGKNKVDIKLFVNIAKMIIDVKRSYTFLNTKDLMLLKNKHSIRLLALLNRISNYDDHIPKRKELHLEDMQEFFGVKYKTWGEMERKILIPVKDELDNNSNLTFIYATDFINLGRGRPKFNKITIDVVTRNSYQGKLL